jgi:hypothetical protein
MNIDRLKKEHPNFTFEPWVNLDDLPVSFYDDSWRNDAGPMFTSDRLGLRLFIDYPPELSDFGGDFPRYALMIINEHGEYEKDLFSSNDWTDTLKCLWAYVNMGEYLEGFECTEKTI